MFYISTNWTRGLKILARTALMTVAGLMTAALAVSGENGDANEELIWQDPQSDLMWSRCPVGKHFGLTKNKEQECLHDNGVYSDPNYVETRYTWWDAILIADASELAGFSDWRIPTVDEVKTLLRCSYQEGTQEAQIAEDIRTNKIPPFKGVMPGCIFNDPGSIDYNKVLGTNSIWTSTAYVDEWSKKPDSTLARTWDRGAESGSIKSERFEIGLVRGGTTSAGYGELVAEATAGSASLKSQREKEIADRKAAEEASKARARKLDEQGRAYAKAYEDAKVGLRTNPKPGDKTTAGLILEVKGNLVRLQTYVKQCTMYANNYNKFTGERNCLSSQTVPAGEQWVRRDELLPPPP